MSEAGPFGTHASAAGAVAMTRLGPGRTWRWAFALALGAVAFAADEDKVFTPGASRTEPPAATAGASLTSLSLILGIGLAAAGGWMVWRRRFVKDAVAFAEILELIRLERRIVVSDDDAGESESRDGFSQVQ